MSDTVTVGLDLLGRRFTFSCPSEERDSLMAAARILDEKMRTIRDNSRVVDAERIAILAALNLTHDLMLKRVENPLDMEAIQRKIESIDETAQRAIQAQADLF